MERFINFFSIIGVKTFQPDEEKGHPFLTTFAGEVIETFPPSSDALNFPESVPMLCQPTGWRMQKDRQEPTFTGFVLTNINAKKTYGACLTFSEEVQFSDACKNIQRSPFDQSLIVSPFSPLSPLHIRTDEIQFYKDSDTVWFPKCMVILSNYPFFSVFHTLLCELYTVYTSGSSVPFSRWVSYLATQVPLPSDQCVVDLAFRSVSVTIPLVPKFKLPVLDLPLGRFFRTLRIEQIVQLVALVLNEKKIVLVSKHFSQLLLAAECLSALLHPFSIQGVYSPIMPSSMVEYVEAPTTYLYGLHRSLKLTLEDSSPREFVIVDLDLSHISVCGDYVPLPTADAEILQEQVLGILHPDLVDPDRAFSHPPTVDSEVERKLRICFFQFFVKLFHGYRNYIRYVRTFPSPVVMFEKSSFSQRVFQRKKFMDFFLSTSVFDNFIQEDGARLEATLFHQLTSEPLRADFDKTSSFHLEDYFDSPTQRFKAEGPKEDRNGTLIPGTLCLGDESLPSPPPSKLPDKPADENMLIWFPSPREHGLEKYEGHADIKALRELVHSLALGKRLVPMDQSEVERVFSIPQTRLFFASELKAKFGDKVGTEQRLEEPLFEFISQVFARVLAEARRNNELRVIGMLLPFLSYFSVQPKTSIEARKFVYDALRDRADEITLFESSLSFWEEVFFDCVDDDRRYQFSGRIANAFASPFKDLSEDEQVQRIERDEAPIVAQLDVFVPTMIHLGTSSNELERFVEGVCAKACLSENTAEEMHSKMKSIIPKAEEVLKKPSVMQGNFIEHTNLPTLKLHKGENIPYEFDKVIYMDSNNQVAEGKLYLSNFKLHYTGYYLGEEECVGRAKTPVSVSIPFGAIFEISKTGLSNVNDAFIPEGAEIHSGDFQIATFGFDEEEINMKVKDVVSQIQELAFPRVKEKMFAFNFPGEDGIPATSYHPDPRRSCHQDNFNELIDEIMSGKRPDSMMVDSNWRVCQVNQNFTICSSYPAYFVVPSSFDDASVSELAKCYRKQRLPVVTWRHPVNKALLLRSALPKNPRTPRAPNAKLTIDDRFCQHLAGLGNSPDGSITIVTEPETTMVFNVFLNKSSQKGQVNHDHIRFEWMVPSTSNAVIQQHYAKFISTCSRKHNGEKFWSECQDTWLNSISDLLKSSLQIIDILNSNTSVIVSLEDGWDRTAQLVSLAQVMLDPWYRTIKGFQSLIQKEWLHMGHRFSIRLAQSHDSRRAEKAPIFLMFIDAVFQLLNQFPHDFEFNEHYLEVIMTEVLSGRFGNFLFNSEQERLANDVHTKTKSLWNHLNHLHLTSPEFYNFQFIPTHLSEMNSETHQLLPDPSVFCMKFWSAFYLFHNPDKPKALPSDFNKHCRELLHQYILSSQPSRARTSEEDKNTTAEIGWYEKWSSLMQNRRPSLEQSSVRMSMERSSLLFRSSFFGKPPSVFLESSLSKLGGKIKNWKTRWFVLDTQSKNIQYFKDSTKSSLMGKISFADIQEVKKGEDKTGDYKFEIQTPSRTYVITAHTPELRTEWMEALRRVTGRPPL